MFSLVIQTLLLMAIAFILGAIVGCLLRNLFGSAEVETPAASVATGAVAAGAVGAASLASAKTTPAPVPLKAPEIPKPPMPAAPERPVEKAKVVATPPAPPKVKTTPKPVPKPKVVTKAAPKPKAKKAPAKPKPAAPKTPDNLKLIRGIGPQNEGRLNVLGVSQFAEIAAWKKKDTEYYGDALAFPGRIEREGWVKQAKVLAKGGTTDFAKRVKSGDVESSLGKAKAGDMGKKPVGMLSTARGGKADDLAAIDGVGSVIEKKLNKLGIYHFDQITKMSKAELVWLGNAVGFPGRPEREGWAKEAKALASGTVTRSSSPKRGAIKPRSKK